ncbi:MAG: GMC family oxidoreductase [Acidobacteriota bacterium]|nr:GMC family oxidoreductase [Acidobacteriota bacterium]
MAEEIADVLIIGSGHSGGMAAKILTGKGISCVMLNAGPIVDFEKDRETKAAHELPYRGFKDPKKVPHVFQASEFNANTWVDEKEVPYSYDPKNPYNWVRVRLFGGRSLFWARQSYRLSDYELKGKDHDGFGENWPLSLADLDPYYSRVEKIFRVRGRHEGLPQYPDGNFVEVADNWSGLFRRMIAYAKPKGIPVCKSREAMGEDGLASSINLLLPDAFATGKLKAVSNAVVREITVDKKTGLANGAHFMDRHSRREMTVKARIVILAAGTLESTRLLMNSGLANSSGVLGRYLIDQTYGVGIVGTVKEAQNGKAPEGLMGGGATLPRFRNIDVRAKDFIRGYAINVSCGGDVEPRCIPAYGEELLQKQLQYRGSAFSTYVYGEVLPRYENHVRINKEVVDAWGIPTLHIDAKYTDNEFNMMRDAVNVSLELADACGVEVLAKNPMPNPPGYSIHELGTCRMGNDPKTSVLNKWNQSHDIKNLFVVDGSSFVSGGWQNPTMTILALSMRASEYLAEQMRQGNV